MRAIADTETFQFLEEHCPHRLSEFFAMKRCPFEFDVQSGIPAGGSIQTSKEQDFILEPHDSLSTTSRKTIGEYLISILARPFVHLQFLKLFPGEVCEVPTSIFTGSAWEYLFDIGCFIHRRIMGYDEDTILTEDNILFDVVGALGMGEHLGCLGVFYDVSARSSVRDYDRSIDRVSLPETNRE
jgi:hypothetical protein